MLSQLRKGELNQLEGLNFWGLGVLGFRGVGFGGLGVEGLGFRVQGSLLGFFEREDPP